MSEIPTAGRNDRADPITRSGLTINPANPLDKRATNRLVLMKHPATDRVNLDGPFCNDRGIARFIRDQRPIAEEILRTEIGDNV